MNSSDSAIQDRAFNALDSFRIEIPSWGFANTGTRFGKFVQAAAATTIEEKFADAAEVNRLTGVTPTVALHVLWDLPDGLKDVPEVKQLERRFGVRSGSINPNLFQDQEYKFGSLCNPSARHPRAGAGPRAGLDRDRQGAGLARHLAVDGRRIELSRHAEHAQAHRMAGGGAARCASSPGARSAVAGGVQALRAGLLSHRYRRLGHVEPPRAPRRAAGVRAGRHRPPLQRAEHRADCGVAAAHRDAGRVPLQRPALCRRRSDAGLDRSLPDLPHLPRDPCGQPTTAWRSTSPT